MIAPLGAGATGDVYRARDAKLDRDVAIKFLHLDVATERARRRFQQEARTASSLNHPHILTVYDADQIDGRHYLVTEFVDGGTLRTWSRAAPRRWQDALEMLIGVAEGLAAAHAAGIVHRDVKPENILVGASGYAKLADFGLAKLFEGEEAATRAHAADATRAGTIVGTVAYMSPEQAQGSAVDARSDIFSFGIVLYELLAGRKPFQGPTELALLNAIAGAAPPPLSEAARRIPPAIGAAVAKALEKDPDERYQTLNELIVDLKRALRSSATESHDGSTRRRERTVVVAAAAAAVVVTTAAGVILVRRTSRTVQPPAPIQLQQITSFTDAATQPALSPDGRMLAFLRGDHQLVGPGRST